MKTCLNLAIARLSATSNDHFAICVFQAPYPGGHVIYDRVWTGELTAIWQEWQQMFANHEPLNVSPTFADQYRNSPSQNWLTPTPGQNYGGRLMQQMGISLWQWVFDGPIANSLERSRGIAMGRDNPLRLRLEIRDPYLIALPWEIMQPQPGQPSVSLSQQLLFSRTTSDVEPLSSSVRSHQSLNILLVLGAQEGLQLEQEAAVLQKTLNNGNQLGSSSMGYAPCRVDTLLQPTPEQLIAQLETQQYNVFFYAGHGKPGQDGGLLFLQSDRNLNGIELAQALTRTGVTLAVFNACQLAQPASANNQAIAKSSLAEVLILHGVPAVLGMRDQISDEEGLSFIQAFAQALRSRLPIDHAAAIARKQLLTVYRFNQPAWTLPVLYLHPEFDGELLRNIDEGITELPETSLPDNQTPPPSASLRSLSPGGRSWSLRQGASRIGRTTDNDIVVAEPWVSRERHAEIFYRNTLRDSIPLRTYYLHDFSTYGTLILGSHGWQTIHHQEIPLESGTQLKFGSDRGQAFEFILEG
ncbi:MAG: CHAT domain-containing protein [Nostocaceae cyanobacterium]|nr:CHAT domain-containing protein [Nostocaceae cyanobacterium]